MSLHDAFHRPGTRAYTVVQAVVAALIVASLAALVVDLNLDDGAGGPWRRRLQVFDAGVLALFAVELVLRVATYAPPRLAVQARGPVWRAREHVRARVRFLLTPAVLLDLVTVIALVPALRGLRALRLFQLLRGVKVVRRDSPVLDAARAFRESSVVYGALFGFLAIVVLVGGVSIYLVEGKQNPQVQSVADGVWWALVTLTTVGYGDVTPATPLGRAFGGGVMVAGMFTLAMFAGVVGATLLSAVLRIQEAHFRMSSQVQHIIVCGYHPGARLLLDALLAELPPTGPGRDHPVIIFAPRPRPRDVPPELQWVEGDPTREDELPKVRPAEAAAVVLVGDRERPPQEADAHTILTAFTLRAYLRRDPDVPFRRRPVYVVAEILDPENAQHARAAGVDEVIETTRLGFGLLAHAVTAPGSGEIMSQVATSGALNVYIGRYPYGEAMAFGKLVDRLHQERGAVVFGVRDPNTRAAELPPPDAQPVGPGMEVVYLAPEPVLDPREQTSGEPPA